MADFQLWTQRALEFATGLHRLPGCINVECHSSPPLSKGAVANLSTDLRIQMPNPIKEFLLTASSHFHINYVWYPPAELQSLLNILLPGKKYIPGGGSLLYAKDLARIQRGCLGWTKAWNEQEPDKNMWLRSFPFFEIGNGDLIALDVSEDLTNPPVVYLCHEGGGNSCTISPDFHRFLSDWFDLCLIRPALWMLEELCTKDTEWLQPHPFKVITLKKLFSSFIQNDEVSEFSILKFPGPE